MTPGNPGLFAIGKPDATHDVAPFACGKEPPDRFPKRPERIRTDPRDAPAAVRAGVGPFPAGSARADGRRVGGR